MPRSFSSNYMWICTVNRWIKLAYRFHGHSPQIFMRKVDHSAPLVWDWHVFLELHSSLLPLDELCTVLSDNKVATFAVWLVLECNIWNKFRRITWPVSSSFGNHETVLIHHQCNMHILKLSILLYQMLKPKCITFFKRIFLTWILHKSCCVWRPLSVESIRPWFVSQRTAWTREPLHAESTPRVALSVRYDVASGSPAERRNSPGTKMKDWLERPIEMRQL